MQDVLYIKKIPGNLSCIRLKKRRKVWIETADAPVCCAYVVLKG
jgi:hypothetical protein